MQVVDPEDRKAGMEDQGAAPAARVVVPVAPVALVVRRDARREDEDSIRGGERDKGQV